MSDLARRRFGFRLFRHHDFQNALVELGADLVRVDAVGYGHRPLEGPVAAFGDVDIVLFLVALVLLLALQRYDPFTHGEIDILLGETGEFGRQRDRVIVLGDVDRRIDDASGQVRPGFARSRPPALAAEEAADKVIHLFAEIVENPTRPHGRNIAFLGFGHDSLLSAPGRSGSGRTLLRVERKIVDHRQIRPAMDERRRIIPPPRPASAAGVRAVRAGNVRYRSGARRSPVRACRSRRSRRRRRRLPGRDR